MKLAFVTNTTLKQKFPNDEFYPVCETYKEKLGALMLEYENGSKKAEIEEINQKAQTFKNKFFAKM